jgi:hypothetical protein
LDTQPPPPLHVRSRRRHTPSAAAPPSLAGHPKSSPQRRPASLTSAQRKRMARARGSWWWPPAMPVGSWLCPPSTLAGPPGGGRGEARSCLSAPPDAGRNGRGIDGGRPDQDAAAGDLPPMRAGSIPGPAAPARRHPPLPAAAASPVSLLQIPLSEIISISRDFPWMYSDSPPHMRIVLHLISSCILVCFDSGIWLVTYYHYQAVG